MRVRAGEATEQRESKREATAAAGSGQGKGKAYKGSNASDKGGHEGARNVFSVQLFLAQCVLGDEDEDDDFVRVAGEDLRATRPGTVRASYAQHAQGAEAWSALAA